jgi:hypothetical protein
MAEENITKSQIATKRIGINPHKHMSPDCPDTLEIDLQTSAEHAITKAIADFTTLYGQGHAFIKAYLGLGMGQSG